MNRLVIDCANPGSPPKVVPLTPDEAAERLARAAAPEPPQPLDHAGVLATLLTVKGVITEDEAQAASGRTIAELRNEAKAWKAAAGR